MTWEELIAKAEELARAAGVSPERLQTPKVRETAVVTFFGAGSKPTCTFHLDASTGEMISADLCLARTKDLTRGKQFSNKAQAVLALANRESKRVGSDHVSSEHLLTALLAYGQGPGPRSLLAAGLSADAVRERVRTVGSAAEVASDGYGPAMRNILGVASVYSNILRAAEIEPEHFVLALLDVTDGPAMSLLRHFKVDAGKVKVWVVQAMQHRVTE